MYDNLGQYEQALGYYQDALVIRQEIGDRAGEGVTLNNIGAVYDNLGQYEQALGYFQDALAISQEIGDRAGEGVTLNNIGAVYHNLGQYEQALGYYQDALAIRQEIGDRQGVGQTLNNIGGVYDNLGQYEQALGYYQDALAIRQEIGDRKGRAISLNNLGYVLENLEEPELAIVFLKQSVNQWEAMRGDIVGLSVEDQQAFTDSIAGSYRKLADMLLQQDRILEAQRVLDLLKVQELDEYLRGVRSTESTEAGVPLRPTEQDLIELYQASQARLIELGQERAELAQIPPSERTPEQQQRLIELRQLESAVRQEFARFLESEVVRALVSNLQRTTGGEALALSQLTDLRDNLRNLEQNAVVLYPLVLEDRLELVLVTANQEPIRRTVSVSRTDLNQAIADLRSALETPFSEAITPAQQLYDWLIRPLENDLAQAEATTLIYAPDGQLRYIPLAALHDGNQWLVERFQVNNITAASVSDLDNPPTADTPSVLAAAFTEGAYEVEISDARTLSFTGLDFAGPEVDTLAQLIPQTVKRLNQAFNLSILYDMDDYSIIHLATHAAFNPGPPEDSFILFGDGSRATLTDVKQQWSFPNVELIVLSACETAVGDAPLGNGEEILGFGYLMQQAGADAAIASLWQVSDGGTQALMDAFYLALQNGYSKAEALQRAQQALIADDLSLVGGERGTIEVVSTVTGQPIGDSLAHPYYWAPFILIGNGL
ncbi:hypothetical protein XM38_040230 [Halomicronema hongdechloris C2206]|uniref:CHAT domain-containing protein n=1 Tax=Halomicronema hongdechloris C2206 TaxID=1641165 RepID=A0A1Z3HRX1_9CYAN|nr:hypothetical protein XM38_040230 [Halomicronema hongdechloris C2206]